MPDLIDEFRRDWGQAQEQYDARVRNPRSFPAYIGIPDPDTPEKIDAEVLDPIREKWKSVLAAPPPLREDVASAWNDKLAQWEARVNQPGSAGTNAISPQAQDTLFGGLMAQTGTGDKWSGPIQTAGGGMVQVDARTGRARPITGLPPTTVKPTLRNVGGQLLLVNPDGSYKVIFKPEETQTITTHHPLVVGTEGAPAEPPVPAGTGLLGTGLFATPATPGKPAVPAVPDVPAYSVSRRVPVKAGTNAPSAKVLTKEHAKAFLLETKGNLAAAKKLAEDNGFTWGN